MHSNAGAWELVRKKVIKRACAGAEVIEQAKKRCIFLEGEVFFLLPARRPFGGTCPLMSNPYVFQYKTGLFTGLGTK